MARDGGGRDNGPTDTGDWVAANACGGYHRASDSSWHGTHVAGIAAAATNNRQGVAGVAPDANILPVRALGACGGYTSDIADGIAWSAGIDVPGVGPNANPADVINLSLGGQSRKCAEPYQRAIDAANSRGATIAVAAGNENTRTDYVQPANCDGVIVVGATGPASERATYSNYGRAVDVSAPGGNMAAHGAQGGILSTVNNGRFRPGQAAYSFMEGTSMATPVVSGVIALMKDANPGIGDAQIERILKDTAQPLDGGRSFGMGAGIVNAQAAVCKAAGQDANCGQVERQPEKTKPVEPKPEPAPVDEARPEPQPEPRPEPAPVEDAQPEPQPQPEPGKRKSDKERYPLLRLLDWWRD